MKHYWLILSGVCVAGCMASNGLQYDSVAQNNIYHIAKIRKGMSEREVLSIMNKPYSYESFEVREDVYDVWFYVTRATGLDQTRMVPQNLTPLTFKNGVLVGTGYYWYYYAMKAEAEETASRNPPVEKPKTQSEEDVEFEKTLKSFTPNSAPTEKTAPPTSLNTPLSQEDPEASKDLALVSTGMSEKQVLLLAGEPMKQASFEYANDVYEVWFYETIPLIFKNTFLISMSEDYYYELKEKVDQLNALTEAIVASPSKTANSEAPVILLEANKPEVARVESSPECVIVAKQRPPSLSTRSLNRPWRSLLGVKKVGTSSLKMGMSQDEVSDILGSPDRQEAYEWKNDVYEVWFYKTTEAKNVPLSFKNGALAGMNWDYYSKIKQSGTMIQINGYDRAADRMQEDESEQNFDYW